MADYFDGWFRPTEVKPLPAVASKRTLTTAICEALIQRYSRAELNSVLPEELHLEWRCDRTTPADADTKRDLITGYVADWSVAQLAALARQLSTSADIYELNQDQLAQLVNAYEQGDGVKGKTKNLIFASTGPKPDLVLRDAVSNDIQIVANGDSCLIYDQPLSGGLRFSDLIAWWASHPSCPDDLDDPGVARHLYRRLADSLASPPERLLFHTYYARFKDADPDFIALVPQVYLHYDPLNQKTRRASFSGGAPLIRQRMDFLMLFSDRRRVVIEVDGKQHYAAGDTAVPKLYSEMVAEDRRLKLAGYQVFRFGGYELSQSGAEEKLTEFFDELHERMS